MADQPPYLDSDGNTGDDSPLTPERGSPLGTRWGLLRHYWVLFSLALTILANAVLLLHMPTVSFFASITAKTDAVG